VAELQGSAPERVGQWLYPLSGPGRRFTTSTGSFAADHRKLRSAALAGTVRDGSGPFDRGFLTVADGDRLWLHDPVGIVGLARVTSHTGRPAPSVTFRVERAATRVLAQDPVPTALLRRWLRSSPRQPIELSHDHVLTEGLEWWLDQLDTRDRHRLEPLGISSLREIAARHRDRLDDPTVAATVRAFRARDLAVGLPTGKARVADLVARNGNGLAIARIVHQSGDRGRRVVLDSLGGLSWYARSLAAEAPELGLRPDLWFVFSQTPDDDLARFLEDEGRSVAWLEGTELHLGTATSVQWPLPRSVVVPREQPSKPRLVVAPVAKPPSRAKTEDDSGSHSAWADHLVQLDDLDHERGVSSVRVQPRDESDAHSQHRRSG
jgi:hypothetical protein